MEDLLTDFFIFQWKKSPWIVLLHLLGLLLFIVGFALLYIYLKAPEIPEAAEASNWFTAHDWVDTFFDIHINLVASFLAFVFAIIIIQHIANSYRRHEDELKVSYKNSLMHKIYKDKGEDRDQWHPYKKRFPLHSRVKHECEVYCNELFFHEDGAKDFCIDDKPNEYFEVNHFIDTHAVQLLGAHSASKTTNEFTPRLSKFVKASPENGNKNTLTITRSTYVNHLLTNRAMDYKLGPDVSLRRLYESIDVLTELPLSKMSNHIGINALVFLKGEHGEKYLIVPRRGKNATVVKNGITASIATRLKVDEHYEAAKDHLVQYIEEECIKQSFERALLLTKEGLEKVKEAATIHFLGLARDPYEGGKPTLFYYVELDKTRKAFWELTNPEYVKEEIDEIEELMLVEWNDIQLIDVTKDDKTGEDNYDNEKLKLKKYYTHPTLNKEGKYQEGEHSDKPFIFEQNLITNFWFYLKHTKEI